MLPNLSFLICEMGIIKTAQPGSLAFWEVNSGLGLRDVSPRGSGSRVAALCA